MGIETLKEKLKLYNQYLTNYSSGNVTKEMLEAAKELNMESMTDMELNSFIKSLYSISSEEVRNKMIEEYGEPKEEVKLDTEEELISKTFGVDISSIEHRTLQSGKEVFSFYDKEYGRKRILENKKEGLSLVEQLKEFQNENEDFQTENYKENANDILKHQANNLDSELQMIYIDDIDNYKMIINGLQPNEMRKLNELLKRKDSLNIKYINIENMLCLDENGNMLESYIDEISLQTKIETPREYSYKIKEIDNQDEVNEETAVNTYNSETDTYEISYNDLEDIPNLIEAELQVNNKEYNAETITEISNNVIEYYKNPDAMLELSEEERQFYEKFVNMLSEKLEYKNKSTYTNQMVYKPIDENSQGFLNIIFLSLIMIMLVMLVIYIMN